MSLLTFSIPSLRCVCTLCSAMAYVCVQAMCVYLYHFLSEIMHMCVFIHMHVPCLSLSLSPWLSPAPRPPDPPAVLTLASPYAAGMGQILAREEMRDGINEGERGHRCQQRMRV